LSLLSRARDLLEKHKEELRDVPGWRFPFEIARLLRSVTDEKPEQFKRLLLSGWLEKDEYLQFLEAWDSVSCPAGCDAFDIVARLALEKPVVVSFECGDDLVRQLAGFAYHAAVQTQDIEGRIQLPRVRLGKWMEVSPRAVTSLVRRLERAGVVRCLAQDDFSYKEHRAKSYKFVGDELVKLAHQPSS
jgi:hypothetical protein